MKRPPDPCVGDDPDSDLSVLNRARNALVYSDMKNSIVAWTLSPDWTTPSHGRGRGSVSLEDIVVACNTCWGEIK